ncbi:MAG: FemAB family XrtA/PEP-CTERM system-associated protein [Pseudomonadota bacterium]
MNIVREISPHSTEVIEGPLTGSHASAWDAFVADHKAATLFHDRRWGDVIFQTYRYQPIYILIYRDLVFADGITSTKKTPQVEKTLVGGLQLIAVRSPLLGHSLISTAFTIGGGPLATDDTVLRTIINAAKDKGQAMGARYVEFRDDVSVDGDLNVDLGLSPKKDVYVNFKRQLEETDDQEMLAIPRRRRAEVRKGLRMLEGGNVCVDHDADLKVFYDLYAASLHRLGTPVFSCKFLSALKSAFNEQLFFSIVAVDSEPVYGLATFRFRDQVMPYYMGASSTARQTNASDLAIFSLMQHGRSLGVGTFDFGRSKAGSTNALYKKTWGFSAEPLTYQYALLNGNGLPNVNPNNPKFSLATRAWTKLPPFVANQLGPILARNFA